MIAASMGGMHEMRNTAAALEAIVAHMLRRAGRCRNQSRMIDPDGCKVETSPATILNTQSTHPLRSMPGTVFHERPAQVSAGQAPRFSEITYTITKVDLRLRQIVRCPPEPKQRGCLWPHLHEPDLPDAADCCRIVPAPDPHHSVDKGRRDANGCRLLSDGRKLR
jgi:hypothetical protein